MDYKQSPNQQNEKQHVAQNSYTAKTSYQKLDDTTHASHVSRANRKPVNKRTKKRNILISLTLLGFFMWIFIVLVNSAKPSDNTATSMLISEQLLALPLPLLQNARHADVEPSFSKHPDLSRTQDHEAIKLQQQRLTQLRMHNVLRGTSRFPSKEKLQAKHLKYSELSGREEKLTYANAQQSELVKRWEWEFQNGSSTR
jgi:hypothetical protein